MQLIKGQYALVTGGGTGIGFGVAHRLLAQGAANVLIVGRREDVLIHAVERLRTLVPDSSVHYKICDITNEKEVTSAVAAASNKEGQLDILVANAGSGYPGPILELDAEAWRFCCELNIVGTAICIKHAGMAMKQHGGSIITISSTSGVYNDLWMAPYGATKAALEHLTKSAALELAAFNIRVNAVSPGYIPTEGMGDFIPDTIKKDCVTRTPIGHAGEPEDIGDAVVYLSSQLAKWVTGQVIGVDGGLNVHVGTDFGELAEMTAGPEAMERSGYKKL